MNQHRGSDFNQFLIEEEIMTPTPRTDAIAHRGLGTVTYIAEMTDFARQLERRLAVWKHESKRLEEELEQERQDRKQADLDTIRALGERNDARSEIEQIKATLADPHAVHINMLRGTIQWTPANLRHLLGET